MMKKINFLILFLAFAGIASAQQDTVFTIRVYQDKQMVERKTFGIHGNLLLRETRLNEDPVLWFREFMIYDKGRLIRSGHYIDDEDVTDYSYEYNYIGKVIRKRETKQGLVTGETFYEYTDNGKLKLETCYVGKRKKITIEYSYNPEGLVKNRTETIVDSNKTLELSEIYFYTEAGKMARRLGLNGDDTISDFRFLYDQYGFKLQQDVISHGDTTLTITWKYGRNGLHPALETHKADGFVVRQTRNTFYNSGRKKKEVITEYRIYSGKMKPEKTVRKYKYTWND